MPRRQRRTRRGRSFPPRVIPFDTFGTVSAASKNITAGDIGLPTSRSVRPIRATISVAIVGHTQCPAFNYGLMGPSDSGNVTVSRTLVVGVTARSVGVSAPRGTDYGVYDQGGRVVCTLYFPGYYNGTITFSGTIWFQYAPHRQMTKVAFEQMCPELNKSGSDDDDEIENK